MSTQLVTPVGRIVFGNPLKGRVKTDQNNNPVIGQDGQPVTEWVFGLAIPKAECGELFQAMQAEAATVFPNNTTPANFAWKFKDGDAAENAGKEGWAGCIVLVIATQAFAPRVVQLQGGAYVDMTDGIKAGDYVQAAVDLRAHSGKPGVRGSVPGLYVNPQMIRFIGYGEAISNGPDATALFGTSTPALPAGASATPVAPAAPMPTAAPAQAAMPGTPAAPAPAAPQPAAPVQPAHDFVQNATGTPGNAAPVAAPQPAGLPGFPGQA